MCNDTITKFSISQANQNFSKIARTVDKNGEAIILKNNKPRYIVIDLENENFILDLTEDERIYIVARRVLRKYLPAFKKLAKRNL